MSRPPEAEHNEETPQHAASLSGASLPVVLDANILDANVLLNEERAARDTEYDQELLRIFRQRLRLLASLIAGILPLYALLQALISPSTRQEVATGHVGLLSLCLVVRWWAPRLKTLRAARALVLGSYATYSLGMAWVAVALAHAQAQSPLSNQFVAYSSFNHIMLSTLILPLAVWESGVITAIALTSMAFSSFTIHWQKIVADAEPLSASHFFVLATTSLLVFYLTHLNNAQRRSAFEATCDLRQSAQRLETLTTLDTVTGGWNRRHLERVLHNEMARAARFAHAFTVLAFDLDNFKIVNDTYGHAVGDDVLRRVERAARDAVRETDTVGRFGGDEFMVVLPETGSSSALQLAQRLQETVAQQLQPLLAEYPQVVQVTLSVGLFTCRESHIYTPEELFKRADAKLYQAKNEGKNRIAF